MPVTDADVHEFSMGFVSASRDFKSQFHEMWQEVGSNFVVDPQFSANPSTATNPYRNQFTRTGSQGVILKDQETHKAIMAWASTLVLQVLGDERGEYVRAMPTGWEDALGKARTATKLMRYAFGMDGTFRSLVEAAVESLQYGTAVVEIPWRYREANMPQRSVEDVFGVEVDSFRYGPMVAHNDPCLNVLSTADAFPDPAEYRIENMCGFAKRFHENFFKARQKAIYDQDAVERAIQSTNAFLRNPQDGDHGSLDENFREGFDQPEDTTNRGHFTKMVGFEYWGDVPWKYTNPDSDDPIHRIGEGSDRGVVTILMGEIVRNRAFPFADPDLPFRTLTIVPTVGRFYGVSLGEVMRYDQDILDALKILLVEAVLRKVHPPIAIDEDALTGELDIAAIQRWSPDMPIPIRGGANSVGALRYDADVFSGIALGNQFTQSAQEASAATTALQGLEGPPRESATGSTLRFRQALSRPQLTASLWEKDELPKIAKSYFRRYQQFLDSEGLSLRVGEMPQASWIGDIMGDFDFKFMGSRLAQTREQKLASADRLTALATGIPQIGLLMPWMAYLPEFIGDILELPEVAALIGDPQQVALNTILQQLGGQGQGAAGQLRQPSPSGLQPAQTAGTIGES